MELLSDLRVRVAASSPAAAYAGWLLRQLGASVRTTSALDPEGLGAFLAPDADFDPAPALEAGPGELLITDAPVTDAARAGLETLARETAVVWVTPFGLETSWERAPSTSLTRYAAGGWMSHVGDPAREPLAPPGSQDLFIAGLWAALAALGLAAPARRGLVEVPVVAGLAATMIYDSVAFQYFGRLRGRVGERYAPTQPTIVTLPCADGHIGIHAALHGMWVTLARLCGHPELVEDPRFASPAERAANIRDLDAYLLPWLARHTRWELYHLLQQHRVCAAALPTIDEVLASPHLAARRAWDTARTPSGRVYRVPGAPVRVIAEAGPTPSPADQPGPWRPGALRVVDLSMGWAGPLVGHVLAALGADVIKVESHTHFDWWRGSRPPGDDPALALHERSHVFNAVNRGKRGITLDLAHPRGRAIALQLIDTADVLVENFAAGVLERLGLDWATLSARNPRLVMLRQPAFGSTGPESGYVAFGNTIEGMSGLSSLVGYEGGPPTMLANACGDPVSGLIGAIAVLAALRARQRDGRGRLLECAQLEGFLPLVSEALIDYQRTGELPRRRGNARPGRVPSGVYPAAGDDAWVAVEVESDAQWAALARLVGDPALADPALGALPAREANRPAIDAALARWTSARSAAEAADLLLARGIPSAPVHTEADVLVFGPLVEAGFWVGEEREPVGFHLYPALAIRREGACLSPSGPAPLLGQHTAEVLTALGYDAPALEGLQREGITGNTPAARARA
ncbi:MAG: CoA transferase [Tepidiforma sp.]|nr:MAG: CoA transferase [Tepidiforma sp.]